MKEIPGYPNYYACEKGFIFTSNYKNTGKFKKMKLEKMITGYLRINLWRNKKLKRFTVHEIIMLTFEGERPKGFIIHHKDDNRKNNKFDNLEYTTQSKNIQYAFDRGRKAKGENHHQTTLKRVEVLFIKKFYKNNPNVKFPILAKKYKVCRTTISNIVNGKTWGHVEI